MLFDDVEKIFQNTKRKNIKLCLLFGTVISPKEIYYFSIDLNEKTSQTLKETFSKNIIRQLVISGLIFQNELSPQEIHLLVLESRNSELSNNFHPKQNINFNKKTNQLFIEISTSSKEKDIKLSEDDIWYLSKHTIEGYKDKSIKNEFND